MKAKNKKRKGLNAELVGPQHRSIQLIAYYLQGGMWRKVKNMKRRMK